MPKTGLIDHSIEKVGRNLKNNAWSAICESIITIILGILLIAWPDLVVKILVYVVGAFFLIKGAYQVINYFIVNGQQDFFNNNLLGGVISLLIGMALLLVGEEITSVFRVAIGIWIIYEALVRMNTAIKMHAAGIDNWKYMLILSIMATLLGVFITFYSGAVVTLIGWMMVVAGIISIVGDVMFIQHVNLISEKIIGKEKKAK